MYLLHIFRIFGGMSGATPCLVKEIYKISTVLRILKTKNSYIPTSTVQVFPSSEYA